MKGPHEYTLQDLLKTIYNRVDVADAFAEKEVITAYNDVVGELIFKLTRTASFRNGVLRVQLTSAALRQEMSMRKESLVEKINEKLTDTALSDIIFC